MESGRATRAAWLGCNNNNFDLNANNNLNNNNAARGIAHDEDFFLMAELSSLYLQICSYDNLKLAFKKAKKGKTAKPYVQQFEKGLKQNLLQLQADLLFHSYNPESLLVFILRDPKTRKICKSAFRDRIVHHAICNIIAPLFEKSFIFDSYANRVGKGTLKAIERFESFKRKVSKNNTREAFVLKADVKHYFETVDIGLLLSIIRKRVTDAKVIWLLKKIFSNYEAGEHGKGMPLGNLTSQFFANVYLNELDNFVKQNLRVKHYIRYVDDFVILHPSKRTLEDYKRHITVFLKEKLRLELHPQKSKVFSLKRGADFLGMRLYPYHRLLKKRNLRKFKKKIESLRQDYEDGFVSYDKIYNVFEGWCAYAKNADTYKLRLKNVALFEQLFLAEISAKEVNRLVKVKNSHF